MSTGRPESTFGLPTATALAAALTFAALSKRIPGSGGPYLYARDAFGDFGEFLDAWSSRVTPAVEAAGSLL